MMVYDEERGLVVPQWTTACPDWEDRIIKGQSLIPCKPLFQDTADNYMAMFNALPLTDVTGMPTMAQAMKPWALEFAETFFGSLCLKSNKRLINEYFMLISKKNGKSTLAAALMLTVLVRNMRFGAEYTILAPTKTIADNAFYPAQQIIKHVPALSDLLHIQGFGRVITHRGTDATLKVVAADTEAVGGSKAGGVLIDERWIFGSRSRAAGVLAEATGGLASQSDGFVINLTTQSESAPAGVFASKLQYAREVRDGKIDDPTFLPVLYEHPKSIINSGAHKDSKNFYMTNPNLGASVQVSFLEQKAKASKLEGVEEEAIFWAKHFNVQIGLVLNGESWVAATVWPNGVIEPEKAALGTILEQCEVITVGVDGGGLDDLFSLSVMGRVKNSRQWLHWNHCWVHEKVLELRKADAPTLQDLEKAGDLTITKRVGQEIEEAAPMILLVKKSGLLHKIGVDPNRISALLDAMAEAGIDEEDVIGISQGWRLDGAMTLVERKLADGTLKHGDQKIMAWAMGNAKVEPRGNAKLLTKQASGRGKIDPLMSMLNASQLLGENPEAPTSITDSINSWSFSEAI